MISRRMRVLAAFLPVWMAGAPAGAAGTPAGGAGAVPSAFPPSAFAGLVNLRQEMVLDGSLVNGNRVDLTRFVDARPAEVLMEEVRVAWSQRPAPIHSTRHDGWLVLTQVAGAAVESVELRSTAEGTEGRWSRLRRGGGDAGGAPDWLQGALPPGSRILNWVAHEDGGRRMATLVAATSASAAGTSQVLVSALNREGFRLGAAPVPSSSDGRVFFLARGSEDIAVTISEHAGRRAVVMHWGRAMP